jgi:hypothetical protein
VLSSATAAIASWDLDANVPSSALASVSVTLSNSGSAYTAVTANLNYANLNPTKAYLFTVHNSLFVLLFNHIKICHLPHLPS